MKRTAVYARYSSTKQDSGTSIDFQLDACRRIAEGPCTEYVDRARTGRAIAGRDEFRRLLNDAEAGKIAQVIVYKYDRLGRNMAEVSTIVADLEDWDVEVVSATEGHDVLARGVHFAVAEHYSRALAERTLAGLKQRFEQGTWTGGKPKYGYKVVERDGMHVLAVNPGEAEIVELVFGLYLNHCMSMKEIARELDDRGVPPRRSDSWEHTSIRGILTNELVTGKLAFNRRQCRLHRASGRRRHRAKSENEQLVKQDESLRIIPDDVFQAAQELIGSRGNNISGGWSRRSHDQMRAFTQLLYCGECGNVLYASKSRNAKGSYVYYRCGLRQRKGTDACTNSHGVREDALIEKVTDALPDPAEVDAFMEMALRAAERDLDSGREEADRLKKAIAAAGERISRLTGLLSHPDTDRAAISALTREIGKLEAEREKAMRALDALRARSETNVEVLAASVRRAISEVRESVANAASPQEIHDAIERLLGPISVSKDGELRAKENRPSDMPSEGRYPDVVAGAGFDTDPSSSLDWVAVSPAEPLAVPA